MTFVNVIAVGGNIMKKFISVLLSFVFIAVLFGCGSKPAPNSTASSAGIVNDDLIEAVNLIKSAEDCVVDVSSVQIDNWSTVSYSASLYFEDSAYLEKFGSDGPSEADYFYPTKEAYTNRAAAKSNLEKAEKLLGTSGDGDPYEAAKTYYEEVSSFLSLVSSFPKGYSLTTFSNAVNDHKSTCASAYEEVGSYIG